MHINKLIVIGANKVFPWEINQELTLGKLDKYADGKYEAEINGQIFYFHIIETFLSKDFILLKVFLTNNKSSGIVVFKPIFS
jgi:hypothetical protein